MAGALVIAVVAPVVAVVVAVVSPTAALAEELVPLPAVTTMEQSGKDAVVACTNSDAVTSNLLYFPPTFVDKDAGAVGGYAYLPLVPDTEDSTVTFHVMGVYSYSPDYLGGAALAVQKWNDGWGYEYNNIHFPGDDGDERVFNYPHVTSGLYRLRWQADPDKDNTISGLWRVRVEGASISCPSILAWASQHGAPDYFGWAGDPVNTATGNFSHSQPVLSYPPHVYGMDTSLTFNSLDPTGSVFGTGTGWKSTWDASLEVGTDELFESVEPGHDADGRIVYRDPQGRHSTLNPTGSGTWTTPEGLVGSVGAASGGYAMQLSSGERWEFDEHGRIVAKCQGSPGWTLSTGGCGGTSNGHGQTVTISWSDDFSSDRWREEVPETVTSKSEGGTTQVVQTLTYTSEHRVSSITSDDTPGLTDSATNRIVGFGYTDNLFGAGNIVAGPTMLSYVTYPHYSGETSGFPVATFGTDALKLRPTSFGLNTWPTSGLPSHSTSIKTVENTYEFPSGRVESQIQESGQDTVFDWGTAGQTKIKWYHHDACDSTCVSTCNSNGCEQTIYYHDVNNRLTMIQDTNGNHVTKAWTQTGTAGFPQTAGATQTEGRKAIADPSGTPATPVARSAAAYDSAGRLIQTAKPDPSGTYKGFVPPLATSRSVADGVVTSGAPTTVTSATAVFTAWDVGAAVTGSGVPANTTVTSVTDSSHVVISNSASPGTGMALTFTEAAHVTRTPTDGATTQGSTTVTVASQSFTTWDTGARIYGAGIPANATIAEVTDATHVKLSSAATATATGVALTFVEPCSRTFTGEFPTPNSGFCAGKNFTVEKYEYGSQNRVTKYTNGAGEETTYTYQSGNTTTLPDTITVGSNTDDTPNAPAVVTTNSIDYTNKRINSTTVGATSTCYLYDAYGRVTTTTTVAASAGCPANEAAAVATNAATTVAYGPLGQVMQTTKPAPTAAKAHRTARWATSYTGAGRVRQQAAPDPDTGFLPPPYEASPRASSADGQTTNGTKTITSATAKFTTQDIGATIAGTGIPANTTITDVTNATTAEISNNASSTETGSNFTITESCKRAADGQIPLPGQGACSSRKFTLTSFSYYPTGETYTQAESAAGESDITTTWAITRLATGSTTCGSGVTGPCKTVVRCGPGVTTCTVARARDTASINDDIDAQIYDVAGHHVQSIAAGGATTTMSYGVLGRLESTTGPAIPSLPFDGNGQPVLRSVVTKYSYDGNGRLTHTRAGTTTSSDGTEDETKYDLRGRVISRTSRANDSSGTSTTTYSYDSADRVVSQTVGTSGEAQTTVTSYFKTGAVKEVRKDRADYTGTSASGLCSSTSVRCEATTSRYDNAGRVITTTTRTGYSGSEPVVEQSGTAYDPVTGAAFQQAGPDPASGYVPLMAGTYNRSVTDGVIATSPAEKRKTVTSATAAFAWTDVGSDISGSGIPAGAYITSRISATEVQISQEVTTSATGVTVTINNECTRASDGSFPVPGTGDCANHHFTVSQSDFFNGGALRGSKSPLQVINHAAFDDATWQTTYGYDARGRRSTITAPNPGYYTPASAVGNSTNTTTTCYTTRGQILGVIGPDDGTSGTHPSATASIFDDNGRVTDVYDPTALDGLDPGADCSDLATAVAELTGNDGHVAYVYDGRGNRLERHSWDGPQGGTLGERTEAWTYNADDSLASYEDAADKTTTYRYAITNGRLTGRDVISGAAHDHQEGSPWVSSLRKVTETYFPSGMTDTVTSILFQDDASGPDDTANIDTQYAVGHTYDTVGRAKQVIQNPGGSQKVNTFTYNAANQVLTLTYQETLHSGGTATSNYWYDLAGRRTSLQHPATTLFRFLYDKASQLIEVDLAAYASWVAIGTYTRIPQGDGTSATNNCPTGRSCVYEFLNSSPAGNMRMDINEPRTGARTRMLETIASTTTNYDTATDRAGRLLTDCKYAGTSCNTGSDRVQHYSYDNASQLAGVTVDNVTTNGVTEAFAYTYDNRGQRLTETITPHGASATTTYYAYLPAGELCNTYSAEPTDCDTTANKLVTYSYDQAGRRIKAVPTSGTTTNYTYNERGLITKYDQGPDQDLTYDAFGYITSITNSSGADYDSFFWDHSGGGGIPQVLQWTGNGYNRAFSYGAERITSTATWYRYDHLGSTTYSHTGTTTNWYEPYGNPSPANTGNVDLTYRSELALRNLLYLRARFYDPTTGTFLTRDSLDGDSGTPTDANPYHYTWNNPSNHVDPSGNHPPTDGDAILVPTDGPKATPEELDVICPGWRQAGQAGELVRLGCLMMEARPPGSTPLSQILTVENVLNEYVPDWRRFHFTYDEASGCHGHHGEANPGIFFCVNLSMILQDNGGNEKLARLRYEFTVIHEFSHAATRDLFYSAPAASGGTTTTAAWPPATSAAWATELGVDPSILTNIEKAKGLPQGKGYGPGELVADCMAASILRTSASFQEYWERFVFRKCQPGETAYTVAERIRQMVGI